jgi:K+-transporting ATPase ATPase C chain
MLFTLVLTGIVYPLAATGMSQALFPARANGSLVERGGKIVGSELIGQGFSHPAYLHPRPSAAGEKGYDATASSGSNLGTTSQKLKDRIVGDLQRLQAENPGAPEAVPAELVTTSGSGLDPHLSPDGARWQIPRIAKARGVAPDRIRATLEAYIEDRDFAFLGEPRVNVLGLNLALDKQFGRPGARPPAPTSSMQPPTGPVAGARYGRPTCASRAGSSEPRAEAAMLIEKSVMTARPRPEDFLELVGGPKRGRLALPPFCRGVSGQYPASEEATPQSEGRCGRQLRGPLVAGTRPSLRAGSFPGEKKVSGMRSGDGSTRSRNRPSASS